MTIAEDNATTRRFLSDLMVDDVAQKMHLARAATATGFGLDACNYTRPFPGTSTQIIHQAAPRGVLSTAATVAGVLGGGGVIASALALAAMLWSAQRTPPAEAQDKASAQADAAAGARIRVFWGDRELTPDTPPITAEAAVE